VEVNTELSKEIKNIILREKHSKDFLITDHVYEHILEIYDSLYVIESGKTFLTKSLRDIENLGYAKLKSAYSNCF